MPITCRQPPEIGYFQDKSRLQTKEEVRRFKVRKRPKQKRNLQKKGSDIELRI